MILQHANSFESRYLNLANLTENGNRNVHLFEDATNPVVTETKLQRLGMLLSDPENVILVADGRNVMVVHSLHDFGGTLFRPESKIAGLQGMSNQATPFFIDYEEFVTAIPDIQTPPNATIMACNDVRALENIPPIARTRAQENAAPFETYSFVPYCILGPFEIKAVLKAHSTDPFELIIALKESREELLAEGSQDGTPDLNPVYRVVNWLWAVKDGVVPKPSFTINNDDAELREYVKKRHEECILPSQNTPNPASNDAASSRTLDQLAVAVTSMCETTKTTNTLHAASFQRLADNDEKKKNRVAKYVDATQMKILLFGASKDSINPATKLNEKLIEFINADSVGAAGKLLLAFMREKGLPDTHVQQGAITAMYNGSFVNLDLETIKDLSVFNFSESSPIQRNQDDSFMVLHMADMNGKAKTPEEIASSMSQNIIVPKNYYEMEESMVRYLIAIEFTWTADSPVYTAYNNFIRQIKTIKSLIKSLSKKDNTFCSKILYAGEIRVKLWANSLYLADARDEANDGILDFPTIISSIQLRSFNIELPPRFTAVTPKTPANLKRPAQDDSNQKDEEAKRRKVTNESTDPTFLAKEGEDWKIFSGRERSESRPAFGSKKMCYKWLTRGGCFSDCPHKDSHLPLSAFSEAQKKAYLKWMEECRQLAKTS